MAIRRDEQGRAVYGVIDAAPAAAEQIKPAAAEQIKPPEKKEAKKTPLAPEKGE